jgi:hypothetical protein
LFDSGPRPYVEIASKFFYDTKSKVKEELLDGWRPAKMEGTPVGLSLKTEGGGSGNSGDDEEELTDSLSRMRI